MCFINKVWVELSWVTQWLVTWDNGPMLLAWNLGGCASLMCILPGVILTDWNRFWMTRARRSCLICSKDQQWSNWNFRNDWRALKWYWGSKHYISTIHLQIPLSTWTPANFHIIIYKHCSFFFFTNSILQTIIWNTNEFATHMFRFMALIIE